MKKYMLPLIGISAVLSACSNGAVPETPASNAEIPPVPRQVNTGNAVCPAGNSGGEPLSVRLNRGVDVYDQGTRAPSRLKAQTELPETLQDLLYSTKSIINTVYYGYSTVNLDAVHEAAYKDFKTDFPDKLSSYVLSDYVLNYPTVTEAQQALVDKKMNTYVDSIGDGHTYYMDRATTDADKNGSPPTPVLGVSLDLVPGQGGLILTSVRLDGPAWTAGLRRGDVILSIGGTALTRTAGLKDADQYTAFRKVLTAAIAAGGDLVLTVKRAGQTLTVRATPAVLTGTSMPWGEVRTDAAGKQHYYLRIPTFSSVAPQRTGAVPLPISNRVHQLVAEARSKGIDNMVVDLRGNGGGLLVEFVGAAAAFAPSVAGESTRYIDGSTINYAYSGGEVKFADGCNIYGASYAVQNPTQWKGKVVVLVDSNSASASEMFSTNMQAVGIKVIGTKTAGVGNTSTYHLDLPAGRSLSVTAGRTLVNGKALAEFITPDVASEDDYAKLADTGVDNTLQAAYDQLNK